MRERCFRVRNAQECDVGEDFEALEELLLLVGFGFWCGFGAGLGVAGRAAEAVCCGRGARVCGVWF